jgi:transcriptional regulator with XRE-family HTH domain
MINYVPEMTIADRIRKLRADHAMTQEDLAARSGLGVTTIQRAERGGRPSADTIASLAAAFNLQSSDLTNPRPDVDGQPYLPLAVVETGRQLLRLLLASDTLDFGFAELTDLTQAELVDRLQAWCASYDRKRAHAGAVAQVKSEIAGTELLKNLSTAGLTVTGATMTVTAYDVDDDCGIGLPVLFDKWDYVSAVVRVGTPAEFIDRIYVMESLGEWETAGSEVVWPKQPESASLEAWIVGSDDQG